ncbi:MAG: YbhB/YbcL family Raf kinase inhibitor-like protein [Bacteroidota bacterium]
MKVYCSGLLSGKYFPNKYAHRNVVGGQNISPPVQWGDVPQGTRSFVLSMIDRHPAAKNWNHWYVINIPHTLRELTERASGTRERMPPGAMELRNSFGDLGYGGPNPPKNSGPHEYVITVIALSVDSIPVGPYSTPEECELEMEGYVLARGSVTGIFQR